MQMKIDLNRHVDIADFLRYDFGLPVAIINCDFPMN